jgi:predicted heme/steroid binding protein
MNSRHKSAALCIGLAALLGAGSAFGFGGMGGMGGGSKSAELPAGESVKVDKAKGADAHTVAELYEQSGQLDKKKVAVRGKVVKVSKGIMGKNWIHLKDGTGEGETAKIVATSQELAEIGDVVTVKGTLYKDKDFGAGYFYKAIIEEGKVSK